MDISSVECAFFFFSSRRRHTRCSRDWSSDVCSSDLSIGVAYANLGQASLAAENIKKAYDLREQVSEREKYRISSMYYQLVTGELEQASQVYELWAKSYPQDFVPPGNLGDIYSNLGQYEKALTRTQEGLRLEPSLVGYTNLAQDYLA